MASNSPTIVVGALNDDELKKSINNLVTHFDEQLNHMVESTKKAVTGIKNSLKSIGDVKIDFGKTLNESASKRVKAQNDVVAAVEKEITSRSKQVKKNLEVAMSFDQIAEALSRERSVVRDFNAKRQGLLPTSEEYRRYEQALARIVEYNDKLKASALGVAIANERAFSFDAKRATNINPVDDRLKQLNRYYAEQEKLQERQSKKRLDAIEKESAAQKKLIDEQYKLALERTKRIPTDNVDLLQAKLERLQVLLRDMRERGILNNSQIATTENEIRKIESLLQNMQRAQEQTTHSATRYTEEIRRQAAEIRNSADYKAGKYISVPTSSGYDAVINIRDRVSVEEKLLEATNRRIGQHSELERIEQSENSQLESQRRAEERLSAVERERLGITQQISSEYDKQRKRYIAPTVNEGTSPFRKMLANSLGIDQKDLGSYSNMINEMKVYVNQLEQAWNKLSSSAKRSPFGKELRTEFQNASSELQRMRRELSKPVSFDFVKSLSANTIDEIIHKIRQLQAYRNSIDLTKEGSAQKIKDVDNEVKRLNQTLNKYMAKGREVQHLNNALARSWNYMKNRLAFYFTVGASTQFFNNLIKIRSEYEMNERALGILLDSASRGTRIFNELSQMALVSPYTLIELSAAAKQLTAYDIAAKDVVDTTRRLADMASAVGVPVERLTYALGQIKAYGYLNSRDARMFANAGIPLVRELANYYTELNGKMVTTADVYDKMKKKAIDYNDVMKVLTKMTDEGGKFFDFQAKMADTLKVRLANLTLAWNNMLNAIGKEQHGAIVGTINGLAVLFRHWRTLGRVLGTIVTTFGVYKAIQYATLMFAKTSVPFVAKEFWALATSVKTSRDAVFALGVAMKSVPFVGWATAIASVLSYFWLFNNSSDETREKLKGIEDAFNGVRKEVSDMFADALKSDSLGTKLNKLREMLELAETEMHVTIPIELGSVDKYNITDKLREAKNTIEDYINFSQVFSETAIGTDLNEKFNDFGANARGVFNTITESINTVVSALDKLRASSALGVNVDETIKELTSGQREDESRLEYLQRLISLYERLGLIGQANEKYFYGNVITDIGKFQKQQEKSLDILGIKNKEVFANMLNDVQGYYRTSFLAANQFEQQVMRVAKRIDINNIPADKRTVKLSAAINEEASLYNWNQFEKEFARQIANKKFGTTIEISEDSKKSSEDELQEWQRKQQKWMDDHGIKIKLDFQTNDTEVSYAKRMLQEAKDAAEEYELQQRKLKRGVGSQEAVDKAEEAMRNARQKYFAAGGDMNELDKKSNKARKQAETELQKALKDELTVIDKVRANFKKLADDNVNYDTAIKEAVSGYEKILKRVNDVLKKYGVSPIDIAQFVGIANPKPMLDQLTSQLHSLMRSGAVKPEEIRDFEVKLEDIKLDSISFNQKTFADSLNNELSRLKDDYELAIALDADPELGSAFADMIGINTETLPRTVKEYADQYTKAMNKFLANNDTGIVLPHLNLTDDDLRAFEQMVEDNKLNKGVYDKILAAVKEIREVSKKDMDERIKSWGQLLDKYDEFEQKLFRIRKTAANERKELIEKFGNEDEKKKAFDINTELATTEDPEKVQELADDLGALADEVSKRNDKAARINVAITNQEERDTAKVGFEEFQKSPDWIVATGDLANMTEKAIGSLIESLVRYKREAKNLSPKEIKSLNSALTKLYKEQRKNNPFNAIANAIDQANERAETYNEKIEEVEGQMEDLINKREEGNEVSDEELDKLEELQNTWTELVKKQKEAGKVDASGMVSAINQTIGAVKSAISMFDDLSKAIGGVEKSDLDKIFGVLDKAGTGAQIGSAFGGYGAAIGAVVGGITGIITEYADEISGNADITAAVNRSVIAVKRLENSYIDLQHAIERAYGSNEIGAKRLAASAKELQLLELERQLELEKSRESKNRDTDKIEDLKRQIKELRYEIQDATRELVDDLMGTDAASFAENLVSSMADAFKKGEDYMEVFSDSFDTMIDNMIMKSIVGRVVSNYIDSIWDSLEERIAGRSKKASDEYAKLRSESDIIAQMDDVELKHHIREGGRVIYYREDNPFNPDPARYRKAVADAEKAAKTAYDAVSQIGDSDISFVLDELAKTTPELGEKLSEWLGKYYKFGEDSETQLSALQAGIQGITEDTAGAIEAYLNGVSQQVYLHSDLLTQIRDAVVGFNVDVQTATMSQILLQLQNSYTVQSAISSMLAGWSNANGMAVRVEMV